MHSFSRSAARKRVAATIAAIGLAALALAGCSSGGASGTTAGSATKGNLTWWGWTPQPNNATAYIAAFNKKYPDIKVTYKQVTIDSWNAALRPALASSTGPDLYGISPGPKMDLFSGFAADLKPAFTKALGSKKVSQVGINGLTTKAGKLAAVSAGSTFAGTLWINQDLFSRYGVTPPKTLSQWEDACATFKKNGVTCFVQGAEQTAFNQDTLQSISDSVKPGVWTKASKGDVHWTDPTIVKAFTIWKKLFSDGIMQPGALGVMQYPDASNAFLSGKAAMVMMGSWYMQYGTTTGMTPAISAAGVADPKPFPIVPIPFPDVAGNGNPSALYGDSDWGLAVNNKSKQKAAAETFATWLGTSTAGQQTIANGLNDIPALNGVTPAWDAIQMPDKSTQQPAIQDLIKRTASTSEPRLALLSANLQQAIGVATTQVAAGQATPEQALQTLQTAAVAAGEKFKN
jgi:ABC-type glycerol-3-phosphate transport system substrate-binding protein